MTISRPSRQQLIGLATGVLGAGLLCLWPSAANAKSDRCDPGYTYRGTREVGGINYVDCERVVDPSLPPCDQVPRTLKGMEAEARGLRRELQGNTSQAAQIASALDEWVGLHQDARRRARERALDQAKDLAIDQALDRLQATARLHHELNVQEAGLLRREWGAIADRLSRMSPSVKAYHLNRIANARTAEQGLKALDEGLDAIDAAYETGKAVVDPADKERLAAVADVLGLVETLSFSNPYTTLLIDDLKSLDNAAYGWWAALAARNRLKSFVALEDDLLREAIRESNRYVSLHNAMAAARRGEGHCRPLVA